MAQRHKDALAIQDGACNPIAIVTAIRRAYEEIEAEKATFKGTESYTGDPAVKLMIHQLSYISGVHNGVDEMSRVPNYSDCVRLCREAIVQEPAPATESKSCVP